MTLPCTLHPIGTEVSRYEPDQVLCDLSNGQTAELTLYPGIYYIEVQGAGGSGGQYGAFGWGRGAGGGSGAGFKGLVRVKRTINSTVTTAVTTPRTGGSASKGTTGGSTTISGMFLFKGGEGGWGGDSSRFTDGGLITVYESPDYDIIQADYLGNGNPTDLTDLRRGGDSVITNDGGGRDSDATSPGAGGCGYDGSGLNGGAGGAGSCLIKYIGAYGPHTIIFAQLNLTADTNGTPGGNSFAAFAESEVSTNQAAWTTFNGITVTDINNWVNTEYHMPTWLAWYNPKPLKVSKLKIMHCINANYNIKDFQVQVSETGSSSNSGEWETVYIGQNTLTTAFSSFEVELPDTTPISKYWRIFITSGTSTSNRSRVSIQDIRIYAEVEGESTVNITPLNVDFVGNVARLPNNIIGNFNTSGYLTIPDIPVTGSNPWEFSTYIQTGSDVSTQQIILASSGNPKFSAPLVEIYGSKFYSFVSSNGSSWNVVNNVSGTYTVLPDTWYYVKFGWNGNEYYVEYSLDGLDYTRDITVESIVPVYQSAVKWALGIYYNSSMSAPFLGKMDLSKTSLRIGNEIVWQGLYQE